MIVLRSGAILRSGRNPFELYLLAACLLSGLAGLAAPKSESSAVAHALPRWAVETWYAGLAVGAAISIIGVLLRGLNSLLVERVGMLVIAGFSVLYAGLLFAEAGPRATFPAMFIAAFAAAGIGRFMQIGRDLRRAEAASAGLRPEEPGGDR